MAQPKRHTRIYRKRYKLTPGEVFEKLKEYALLRNARISPGTLLDLLTEEERRVLRGLTSDETTKERISG